MNKIKNNRLIVIISWIAVILWMLLIFNLSSQVASESDELSRGVTEVVVETVKRVLPEANITVDSLNHMVRKNAHFFAYMVLGILVLNAIRRSGFLGYRSIILALVICILYAISDEVHQRFVPGRGPQVRDVFIDGFGGLVGLLVYLGLSRIKR